MSATPASSAMRKLTPVLTVEAIEPCLSFWVDRLEFTKTVEVPDGDRLGFVILVRDGVELMYQTKASLEKDLGQPTEALTSSAFLFLEVADLDAVERAMDGVRPLLPRRRTFYGMDELVVREPGGNVIIFAQPVQ